MPSFERPGRFIRRTWADLQLLKSGVRVYIPVDGSFNYGGDGTTTADHAARHAENAADELDVADLASGAATSGQVPTADGSGGVDWDDIPASGPHDLDDIAVHTNAQNYTAALRLLEMTAQQLNLKAPTDLTIAAGAVTITQSHHRIDTEAAAASDDLDTISGFAANRLLLIHPVNGARAIVIKHNTGNILTFSSTDIQLAGLHQTALLYYDAAQSKWFLLGVLPSTIRDALGTTSVDVGAGSLTVSISGSTVALWDDVALTLAAMLRYSLTAKTIASDQVAIAAGDTPYWSLAGAGGAADDLDGITGGTQGDFLILSPVSDSVTITVKHNNAGGSSGAKIFLNGDADLALDDIDDVLTLIYKSSLDGGAGGWMEVSRNVAPATPKIAQQLIFVPQAAGLVAEVLQPARICVGESGEHGTYAAIRAKATAGTAGAGTNTILIEADDNPAFTSAVTLFTLALNTSTEVDDTVLDTAWASGDIFIRARCTAVDATEPLDVVVEFYFSQAVY